MMKRSIRRVRALAAVLAGTLALGCEDDPDSSPEVFQAQLTGASERPTPVVTDATGTATVTFNSGNIAFTINVAGLSGAATAAHIHGPGDADDVASPVVTFTGLTSVTTGVLATGTFTVTGVPAISMDSLRTMIRNGQAYVNVHTAANVDGEIRGQLVINP